MADRFLRSTEITPVDASSTIPILEETKGLPNASVAHMLIRKPPPGTSFFCSIARAHTANDKHSPRHHHKPAEDFLSTFPDTSQRWDEIMNILTKGKKPKGTILNESYRKNVPLAYMKLCTFFEDLVSLLRKENEQKCFSDDLIFAAILGMEQAYKMLKTEPDLCAMKTFNEFLFALLKIKCSLTLQKPYVLFLQKVISGAFESIQARLDSAQSYTIKYYTNLVHTIYGILQTLLALAIFTEPPALTEAKYNFIFKCFQSIFAWMEKVKVAEEMFNELHDFEKEWQEDDFAKLVLTSFRQKRLSIYLLKDHIQSKTIPIKYSLKYVVIKYNYKILKIAAHRIKLHYDKHQLNAFLPLVKKYEISLRHLVEGKQTINFTNIMLLLNESAAIIKSQILGLIHFSEKLDKTLTHSKYTTIKEIAINALTLAVKNGLFCQVKNRREVDSLSIFFPSDLVAVVFKALLLFKAKGRAKAPSFKYEAKMLINLNAIICELLAMAKGIVEPMQLWTFRLYLLQFISRWELIELKQTYRKYVEETTRVIYEANVTQEEGSLLNNLQERCFDQALDIYLKLSLINCCPIIETVQELISKSTNTDDTLFKYFYTLTCLFSKAKVPIEDFAKCQKGDPSLTNQIFSHIVPSKAANHFVEQGGLKALISLYMNNLDSSLSEVIGRFILNLITVPQLAEKLLLGPCLNYNFYCLVFKYSTGQEFLLQLLAKLSEQITDNLHKSEHIEYFIVMVISTLSQLDGFSIRRAQERSIIISLGNSLKRLMSDEATNVCMTAREITFRKALLPLFIDLCKSDQYNEDIEIFMVFLNLAKAVMKKNSSFHENTEFKSNVYPFVEERFKAFTEKELITTQSIEEVFNILLAICFEKEINILVPDATTLIKEICALETYYTLLLYCFTVHSEMSRNVLVPYILYPLQTTTLSLYNCSLISLTRIPKLLIKLSTSLPFIEIQKHVSSQIGKIGSTNSTPQQVHYILKRLKGRTGRILSPQQFNNLVDTLVDMILGESISRFYYFDGTEQSYIKLRSNANFSNGFACAGYIQLERMDHRERQCIFSLLQIKPGSEFKGVELGIEGLGLVYRVLKGTSEQVCAISKIELKENVWHFFLISHINKRLFIMVDETIAIEEVPVMKNMDLGVIGASVDPITLVPKHNLIGEIAKMNFYDATPGIKELIEEIMVGDTFIIKDEILGDTSRKLFDSALVMTLNPRFHILCSKGKDALQEMCDLKHNCIESIQATQVFYNRPAKDVLAGFGGFKTCLLILSNNISYQPVYAEYEITTACTGIVRLLCAHCMNNDLQTIRYCLEGGGIDILKHILQSVGENGKFPKEFAEVLFNILELPFLNSSEKLWLLVPEILTKLIFNLYIWSNSDISVQRYIIEHAENLFERAQSLEFPEGEPYRAVLNMLFDYYAPETAETEENKAFLQDVRTHLMDILLLNLEKRGLVSDVNVLAEHLTIDAEKCYSVKDLLYVLMVYMGQKQQSENIIAGALVESYKRKDQDSFFLIRIFSLLKSTITSKKNLIASMRPSANALSADPKLECLENTIAYIIHLLLSIQWEGVYTHKPMTLKRSSAAGSTTSFKSHSSDQSPLFSIGSVGDRLLDLLKPKKRNFAQTEEFILYFLLNTEINGDKFLGKKTYASLLSHVLAQPEAFYEVENDLSTYAVESLETNIVYPKFRTIYRELLLNIEAFQLQTQEKILCDVQKFLSNPTFVGYLLSLEDVFDKVFGLLQEPEYLSILPLKRALEDIVLAFLHTFMKDRQKRETMQRAFRTIGGFPPDVLLEICDKFLGKLLKDPLGLDEVLYNSTQIVYFIEDAALQLGVRLGEPMFIEVVGKLMLYLNEIKMLYLWYPPLYRTGECEAGPQREGGMVRVIFKVLMGILLRVSEKGTVFHCELALNLLKFYLYHKRSVHEKIAKALGVENSLPSLKESFAMVARVEAGNESGFIGKGFNPEKEQMHSKRIWMAKGAEPSAKDNCFERRSGRILYVLTQIAQVFIYTSYNVTRYQDIDHEKYISMEKSLVNTYKSAVLAKLLARIVFDLSTSGEDPSSNIKKILAEYATITRKQLAKTSCYSSIDFFCTSHFKKTRDKTREFYTTTPIQYLFTPGSPLGKQKEPGSPCKSPRKSPRHHSSWKRCLEDCISTLQKIKEAFENYHNEKLKKQSCIAQVTTCILSPNFVKENVRVLHKIATEDLLDIDEIVQSKLWNFFPDRGGTEFLREAGKGKRERIFILQKTLNQYSSDTLSSLLFPTSLSEGEKIMQSLAREQKRLFSEAVFEVSDKESKAIYDTISKEYNKLLKRCPLYMKEHKKNLTTGVNTFVKLDLAADNLGRHMRLKKLKDPLNNSSVLKGISYMRHSFLKRLLIKRVNFKGSEIPLITNKYVQQILIALLKCVKPRLSQESNSRKSGSLFGLHDALGNSVSFIDKARTSSYILTEYERERQLMGAFDAEMIRLDHSVFGSLEITEEGLVFVHKFKDMKHPDYQWGPLSEISTSLKEGVKKVWLFDDITQIIARRYNLIKQAVEIFLRNNKSVFMVIFPRERLHTFFNVIRKATHGRRKAGGFAEIIIENPIEAFHTSKFTEMWRRKKLTTFEYLFKLNHYGGRSFQDLSQYPIFPWILCDFRSSEFSFSNPKAYRDLKRTIAGLTDKKIAEANIKYNNTDDFCDGRFQFGTHYMPGRVVLAYLMRIQPYTWMIDRFDSGGDVPARHFHFLETLWRNLLTEADTNYELIPEYFYNPDVLVNLNKYSFGRKVVEELYPQIKGQVVRIDGLVLPPWADNNHHFTFINYMALEHDSAREKINDWIDLVFGVHQQSAAKYNLFKPLADEGVVYDKLMRNDLTPADLNHISEFGHNPIKLFEDEHEAFKGIDDVVYDPLSSGYGWRLVKHLIEKDHDKSVAIRLIPVGSTKPSIIISIGTNHAMLRKQLALGKGKIVALGKAERVLGSFPIYDPIKCKFYVDPCSVYPAFGNYFVACRDLSNRFSIYRTDTLALESTIAFHKSIITAAHISSEKVYTGDYDGVVAVWDLPTVLSASQKAPALPIHFFNDHETQVVCIHSSFPLDMYASASTSQVSLRILSTHKFFRILQPALSPNVKYNIFKVLLSNKGYVVFQLRSAFAVYDQDIIVVYSINGVKVVEQRLDEFLNCILLESTTEYFIITGGSKGRVRQFPIITMQGTDLHKCKNVEEKRSAILSINFVGGTGLLVGLSNNHVEYAEWKPRQINDLVA